MNTSAINQVAIFARVGYEMLTMLNKEGKPYQWLHTVWSGYNKAFRQFFPHLDVVDEMNLLAGAGLIKIGIAKGGVRFQPSEILKIPFSVEEERYAAQVREFIMGFKIQMEQERQERQNQSGVIVFKTEAEAIRLIKTGKLSEALKLLGL